MIPRIVELKPKKLVGMHKTMSFVNFNPEEVWRKFMPRKNEIKQVRNSDLISMAIYPPDNFLQFNPQNQFEKWAAIEVMNFSQVPKGMQTFIIPKGVYVVFDYKGIANDRAIFDYIFGEWLPGSEYELDERPHFEVLGEKYKNNDLSSEEEIWIPVKKKAANKPVLKGL